MRITPIDNRKPGAEIQLSFKIVLQAKEFAATLDTKTSIDTRDTKPSITEFKEAL